MPGVIGRSGGHNRKSREQKALAGNDRADRRPTGVAVDEVGAPDMPDWLAGNVEAVAAWERIVSTMLQKRTITPADRDSVALVCVAESEYRRADAILQRDGMTIETARGLSVHPLTKVAESAWRRWAAGLAVLGLSPVMRDRIAPRGQAGASPFAKFGRRAGAADE